MCFKKLLFCIAIIFCAGVTQAQHKQYSVANAHAHNDYNHPQPFYTAYNAGFGSIEADIFLHGDALLVAHTMADVAPEKTLQALYLNPLRKAIQTNRGSVYADSAKSLLFLIDLKTPVDSTLTVLLKVLQQYQTLTSCSSLKIVITDNRPDVSQLHAYPSYIYFDGDLNKTYTTENLKRIALFSHDFRRLTAWNGEGQLADDERKKIETAVATAHALNKPIRFWAAPDIPEAWRQFMRLNVDYINTDKIASLSAFFKKEEMNRPQ